METGGFKGRSRVVARDELYDDLARALGIPVQRMVNEYGMTELLSQLYDPVLVPGGTPGRHLPPPWLRVRALHPDTLAPQPPGQSGILQFFDLANAGSVSAILTEDVGVVDEDGGVRLRGRSPGSEPRGCSLAMEELLGEGAV
jgi:acyl-coenzyme A synthetase/AMP-(fatty) acid ligase